jgi:uncharacterized membrane protein YedE/YeeE
MSVVQPLVGGALIGVAAAALLLLSGRIAGVSSIAGGLLSPRPGDHAWRVAFVAGLVVGGLVVLTIWPAAIGPSPGRSPLHLAIAGLLVGVGTSLASGCTSGHGVCGVARLSPRSLVATGVFMVTGMITVALFARLA